MEEDMGRLYPVTEFHYDISDIPKEWLDIEGQYEFIKLDAKTLSVFKETYLLCLQKPCGDEQYWERLSKMDPAKFLGESFEQNSFLIWDRCKLVYCKRKLVGMYLGAVDDEDNTVGAIEFIGVLPEKRNRGLGADLHKLALVDLHKHGFTRYSGGTARNNTPMILLFNKIAREIRLLRTEDFD
jgi:GNAT superfamily N-acetyltransferase